MTQQAKMRNVRIFLYSEITLYTGNVMARSLLFAKCNDDKFQNYVILNLKMKSHTLFGYHLNHRISLD